MERAHRGEIVNPLTRAGQVLRCATRVEKPVTDTGRPAITHRKAATLDFHHYARGQIAKKRVAHGQTDLCPMAG
jgi:hypothetical protein